MGESILKNLSRHTEIETLVFTSPLQCIAENHLYNCLQSQLESSRQYDDETLEFKYDVLAPAFVHSRVEDVTTNVTEDNLPKLYEDIVETIKITTLDQNGDPVEVEVASYVQEFDVTKFNRAKSAAFQKIRSDYNLESFRYEDYFKIDAVQHI